MPSSSPVVHLRPAAPSEPPWETDPAPPPAAVPRPVAAGAAPAASRSSRSMTAEEAVPLELVRAVRALLGAVLECVDGRRSPDSLGRRLEAAPAAVVRDLARRRDVAAPRTPAGLRTVQLSRSGPAPGTPMAHTPVFEVCATYARGRRLYAIAARIGCGPDGVRLLALRMLA